MQVGLGSKIVSTLGNPSSKVPLAVKDVVNSLGFTYFSYDAGGKLEGKDRFIDEFGTQAIWLWGIPVFKKIFDNTVYRAAKMDSSVDPRVITSKVPEYLDLAKKYAPTEKIKNAITHAADNTSLCKKLSIGKFAFSTLMTLGAYMGLTKVKQHITKKNIEKEFLANNANYKFVEDRNNNNGVFRIISDNEKTAKNNTPSFGSLASVAENFMFDPVKNLFLVDAGITSERLTGARTKGEFIEYGVKEGSFLFFVYGAGKYLQKGIEKLSEKFLKVPVKLDARCLASKELKQSIKDGTILEQLKPFKNSLNGKDLYEFIFKNPDNIVVKAAQKSGIIHTVKVNGKELTDTSKFIKPDDINSVVENLEKFVKSFDASKLSADNFLKKAQSVKIISTAVNIGICCLALGIAVPKLVYKIREKNQNGSKEFHVKNEYEKQFAESFKARSASQS